MEMKNKEQLGLEHNDADYIIIITVIVIVMITTAKPTKHGHK